MNELKMSSLLTELMEAAKKIGTKSNPPFTAERFILAALDRVNAEGASGEELSALRKQLGDAIADPAGTKEALLGYINGGTGAVFLDDLYMKKKLQEAQHSAGAEVTAPALLNCILQNPSDAIKPLLKQASPAPAKEPTFAELLDQYIQSSAGTKSSAPAEEAPKTSADVKGDMAALVEDIRRIRRELQDAVYGQDNAINVFTTGYFQASMLSMIDPSRRRPRATFLFAGPPGVGKTFLAEKSAQVLGLPFRRFDMSEYADKEANLEFCGSDKVYKNAKSGNVTSFVAQHPKCVLLFDEIEKAHLSVIYLFLQMLDAGRLRDNYTDEEVSFSDAIIILTTNAGRQLYEEWGSGDLSAVSRKVVVKALQKDINPVTGAPFFPGALCSRFASGNVVMFNHMGANELRNIAKKEIGRHAANLEARTGIRVLTEEPVFTALLLSEGSAVDARTIRGRAETFFNDELYELLRMIGSEKTATGIDAIENIRVTLDLTNTPEEIRSLFVAAEKPRVLVFAGDEVIRRCGRELTAVRVVGARTMADALDAMKDGPIDLALLDMRCDLPEDAGVNLNIEDACSPVRDFYRFLREQGKGLPVYLLEAGGPALDEEERISFLRQGVRGILSMEAGDLPARVGAIGEGLHQQQSLTRLAKENKLVSFETAQSVSADGRDAQIRLFDLKMAVAVDSEDAKNILSAVSKPNVRFDDVIGAEEAKEELAYFVEYLKNPRKYVGTGVKAPRGVLLYGPPGTGKTMLAKAMACEAGVTFIAAEGNQFLKKYVGEGSERVHELFKTARKYAPAILFVDEIDAIAKERRGSSTVGGGDEQTLTAFLTEMDGFTNDPTRPVFVLAATNFEVEPGRARSLDPALMRRFDRRVYIDLPNRADRTRFLKMKIRNNPALDISDTQVDHISLRATGMSLAELDSAVELALRSAIREGSTKVTDAIFEEAFENFNSGEVKKWDAAQLERVARHEAGHALLCWLGGETPSYLTIVARGDHGGYMQHAEQEGKAIFTRDELLARIRTSLGGRAAEMTYYGADSGISTGAGGDLATATNLARQLVCSYGMDEQFGLAVVGGAGEAMSTEVRSAVNRILSGQMEEALRLIGENKDKIDALVAELMSKNHLNGPQIEAAILGGGK